MKIIAPTECPSCGSTLERVKDQLFCRNSDDCPAQSTKRLQNFCKKLKIKGFGEATLNKLELRFINDLLYLRPETAVKKGFSEHMANKLVDTINARLTQGISPNEFLAAMSIPLIGDGAMRKLQFSNIKEITYDMCKSAGIGDKAAGSLLGWIESEWDNNYKDHWEQYFTQPTIKSQTTSTEPTKGVVCITGKLDDFKNRTEAAKYLESFGYEVKTSVTKAVQYLISEDGKESSSYKKALNNGITITTIKDLLEDN